LGSGFDASLLNPYDRFNACDGDAVGYTDCPTYSTQSGNLASGVAELAYRGVIGPRWEKKKKNPSRSRQI
jgi:hypothetical protein